MVLNTATLATALIHMDDSPSQSVAASAEAWFNAWWTYASEMSFWNPLALEVSKAAAREPFILAILPAMVPNPVPGVFFLALETAMGLAWPAASVTPGALLPAYAPLPIAPVFIPSVLSAALVALVPTNLASPIKEPPRIAIATAISSWTPLSFVAFLPGSPPTPTPIV